MGRSFAAPSDRKPVAALMEALALPAGSAAHPAAGDVASSASSTCRRPQQAAVVHDEGARTEPALDGLAGLEVVPGLSGGREASRSTDDVTRRRWSCVVAAVNDGGKQAPAAHVSECPGGGASVDKHSLRSRDQSSSSAGAFHLGLLRTHAECGGVLSSDTPG